MKCVLAMTYGSGMGSSIPCHHSEHSPGTIAPHTQEKQCTLLLVLLLSQGIFLLRKTKSHACLNDNNVIDVHVQVVVFSSQCPYYRDMITRKIMGDFSIRHNLSKTTRLEYRSTRLPDADAAIKNPGPYTFRGLIRGYGHYLSTCHTNEVKGSFSTKHIGLC